MAKILKRSSFSLVRTNPRLTTNLIVVADSKDGIFLESIDADPELSRSIYKGFRTNSSNSYSFDVNRFFSQSGSLMPTEKAFKVFERDASKEIKDRYKNQFDFTYAYGAYVKNSRIYDEEFALMAPIWLERDNLPDYFAIFKIDGPVSVNALDFSLDDKDANQLLDNEVKNPNNFFANFIQKSRIIKTFDLTNKSELGRYIRKHVNDNEFPESSIYAQLHPNSISYWQGISYEKGGFAKKGEGIYDTFSKVDKTIIENDDYITSGFQRNGIALANILNLEFLFDDKESEKYEFSRYFGIYFNEAEIGQFQLDPIRLFNDRDIESSQLPRPIDVGTFGNFDGSKAAKQQNINGIKVYPELILGPTGVTGIQAGRLITWEEIQNPRFPYIKDSAGTFYSIDNSKNWKSIYEIYQGVTAISISDPSFLRIKNKSIDWKTFGGYEKAYSSIDAKATDSIGRAHVGIKIIGTPSSGDEIRIQHVDWTNIGSTGIIDAFTLSCSAAQNAGTNSLLVWSNRGTSKEIAKSIVGAINSIRIMNGEFQPFNAIQLDDIVLIYAQNESELWNNLEFSLFSTSLSFPFQVVSRNLTQNTIADYVRSPISISVPVGGFYIRSKFSGARGSTGSKAIVSTESILELLGNTAKTKTGYSTVESSSMYLDVPIRNDSGYIIGFNGATENSIVFISDANQTIDLGINRKISLHKKSTNKNGYLSILPIKDFDFDFWSTYYNQSADSDVAKLFDWYEGGVTGSIGPTSWIGATSLGSTSMQLVKSMFGPTSTFVLNGGFQSLIGFVDEASDIEDPISNEYDRLKENYLPQLALASRTVPFICKWVYDNESSDVRDAQYRLNSDQSFSYGNFGPSFDHLERNQKFFTHEWYYLQKYPPYMSFEERILSDSFFDEEFAFDYVPFVENLNYDSIISGLTGGTGPMSVISDYFTSYFTRESVAGVPIPREFKYSIFSYGDDYKYSETLFRGVKVEVKDRSENSSINYNKNSLKFVPSSKYNGYKFSAVLCDKDTGSQITVIKNDKWKSIVMVIQSEVENIFGGYTGATGPEYFIDRTHLYALDHRMELSGTDLIYTDTNVSGGISNWTDNGNEFLVIGGTSSNGSFSNFADDLTLNENGSYNQLIAFGATYSYTFNQIYDVTSNSFKCTSISSATFPGNVIFPNGNNDLFPNIYFGMWSGVYWLRDGYIEDLHSKITYLDGGFNSYKNICDSLSFGELAHKINSGDPSIRYVEVNEIGNVKFDSFCIDFVKPDPFMKLSYAEAAQIKDKPVSLQNSTQNIGYEIVPSDRIAVSEMVRYRGGYNPRVKDVFRFVDTPDIINDGLDFYNIQFFLGITGTTANSNGLVVSGSGYSLNEPVGIIPNLYFNKTNAENPNLILQSTNVNELSVFPLIDEIAIAKKDHFVFRSNWDPFFYSKHIKKDVSLPIIGTREIKESKAFLGSKILALPNTIEIETIRFGSIDQAQIPVSGINTIDPNISTTLNNEKNNSLIVRVYGSKILEQWLLDDGFGDSFKNYVDPNYSFGLIGLDDDVKAYIRENLLERYFLKKVDFFEKILKKGETTAQLVTDLTDVQKLSLGYVQSKSFQTVSTDPGNLDFELKYSVPFDKRTSISFSLHFEKK